MSGRGDVVPRPRPRAERPGSARRGATRRFVAYLTVLTVAGAAAACAPGTRTSPPRSPESSPIRAEVTNNSGFSLQVYVVSETSQKQRLGSMGSFETSEFRVPSFVSGSSSRIQLMATPVGSRRTYFSKPVIVQPGNVVVWTILNESGRTAVRVEQREAESDTAARP